MLKIYILLILLISVYCGLAQDMHFSQYQRVPLITNPALAGVMESNHRLTGNIRRQWSSVVGAGAWEQAHFSYDARKCIDYNFLAFGVHLQSDKMGTSAFSNSTAAVTLAYHQRLDKSLYLSAGASLGALNYRINSSKMTFDEQFGITGYDPGLSSMESFETFSRIVPDLSAGLLLFSTKNDWTIGAALHHINQPSYSFLDQDANRLGMGISLHGSVTFTLSTANDKSRLTARSLFRRQSVFGNSRQWQLLSGVTWRYGLSQRQRRVQELSLGLSFRLSGHAEGQPMTTDAIIPAVYFDFDTFSLGFSYDVNISSAITESHLGGGWEISVAWQISKNLGCVVCPEL